MPTAFISYSHDSTEHSQRVRALAEQLRDDGVDVQLDQIVKHPALGWRVWSRQQLEDCDFTILVCTPTYKRRFEQTETPGMGLGATWEALIAEQMIYEAGGYNESFLPVLFDDGQDNDIPISLRSFTYYSPSREYGDLLSRLLGKTEAPPRRPLSVPSPRAAPAGSGVALADGELTKHDRSFIRALQPWKVTPPPSKHPAKLLEARYEVVEFEGRIEELAALDAFTNAEERDGALVIVGPGGSGKTRLMLE